MIKSTALLLLIFIFSAPGTSAKGKKPDVEKSRAKIGPIYKPPVEHKGQLFFLSSEGRLFQSNLKIHSPKEIFKTELPTISGLAVDSGVLYFGDGVHEHTTSHIYAFDLNKKKLKFKKQLTGHFEKTPLVVGEHLILSAGKGGLLSVNKSTGELQWQIIQHSKHPLHVDMTPVHLKGRIYFSSIYDYKAILAADAKSGQVIWSIDTDRAVKPDLRLHKDQLIAIATDATASPGQDRGEGSTLLVVDTKKGKVHSQQKLRGHNLFPPLLDQTEVYMAMSTGDFISYRINDGQIKYLDLLPEPIATSPFHRGNDTCVASAAGRIRCYNSTSKTLDRKTASLFVGETGAEIQGRQYLPSRTGYYVLSQ